MRSLMSTGIISPMASMLGPSCGRSWMLSKSSANCSEAVAVVVAVVVVAVVAVAVHLAHVALRGEDERLQTALVVRRLLGSKHRQ